MRGIEDVILQLAANNIDKHQHESLHGNRLRGVEPMHANQGHANQGQLDCSDSSCLSLCRRLHRNRLQGVEPMQRNMSNLIAPTFMLKYAGNCEPTHGNRLGVGPMCAEITAAWESPSKGGAHACRKKQATANRRMGIALRG